MNVTAYELAGAAALIASLAMYAFGFRRPSVVLLALAALCVNLLVAQLDPFLNLWDEQFHALVAKHMAEHPFLPTLYDRPVLPYDFKDWMRNSVWLHKPPLFLWQMALSIKLLGATEFAVRLPSVLLVTFCVPLVYRIGWLAVSERAGFFGAVLFAVAPTSLALVSGRLFTDHNDLTFLFYVTASIWAWLEYNRTRSASWAVVVGAFVGLAILTKYLVGLTAIGGWAVALAADREQRRSRRAYAHLILALLVAAALCVPWDVYTQLAFPAEHAWERGQSHRHFWEVMEEHDGDAYFYLRLLPSLFGPIAYLLPLGLVALLASSRFVPVGAFLFTSLFGVYAFYSVAATKMPAFTYVVSPVLYVAMGALCATGASRLAKFVPESVSVVAVSAVVGAAAAATAVGFAWWAHPAGESYWQRQAVRAEVYRHLEEWTGGATVIFNAKDLEHVPVMFYSRIAAYSQVPTAQEISQLAAAGERIAVFDDGSLPDYLNWDRRIVKIAVLLPGTRRDASVLVRPDVRVVVVDDGSLPGPVLQGENVKLLRLSPLPREAFP